jgi:hypothetical protein
VKDVVIAVVVTLILIGIFSTGRFPAGILPPMGNIGTQYPGDSGLVLPGGGSEMAEVVIQPEAKRTEARDPSESTYEAEARDPSESTYETEARDPSESTYETEEDAPLVIEIKEENKMDNVLLAFWHGVATVLIGETVALMVAIAWMKIKKGDKNGT